MRNLRRESAISDFRPSINLLRNTTAKGHYNAQIESKSLTREFVTVQASKPVKAPFSEPRCRDVNLNTHGCSTVLAGQLCLCYLVPDIGNSGI